ncbi:hypothetical protein ABW636_19080 [Aquimarina sp. 2201CG1-2-11]|uniref:hypothetical protein n=1 Tax=Aquimarina discodermiae TaxID=3231043 RepID=UPI003462A6E3
MTTPYQYLTTIEKQLVEYKMAKKLKTPVLIIKEILTTINPQVKIVENQVIMVYETLKKIEQEVKEL